MCLKCKSLFFEKTSKIDETLVRLTKKKSQIDNTKNEREITTDLKDI